MDAVRLASAEVFVQFCVDHGFKGCTRLYGGTRKRGFAEWRRYGDVKCGLAVAPVWKEKVSWAGFRVLDKGARLFDVEFVYDVRQPLPPLIRWPLIGHSVTSY